MLHRVSLKNDIKISNESKGLLYGFIGVLSFSLTLPMTKIAIEHLDVGFVILGRAFFSAIAAMILLIVTKQPLPDKKYMKSLMIVASGAILGFPLFTSLALKHVPASHGAVITALLPLMTLLVAKFKAKENQSPRFWIGTIVGSLAILIFSLSNGNGLKIEDLLLFMAVVTCGFGYAEGGILSKSLGSWQVICWALVITLPITSFRVLPVLMSGELVAPVSSWAGFLYISFISQFLGFFAWYHGMSLANISKVSQLQLLQPIMTIFFSAFFFGESISVSIIMTLMVVLLSIIISRKKV